MNFKIRLIPTVFAAAVCASCAVPDRVVFDPYASVDWSSAKHLKTALHVHTANSQIEHGAEEGTTVTPAEQIARYEELGYDVLALSDHDYISYPWVQFGCVDSKLIAIKANELSKNDNMLSLFNDYLDRPGKGPNDSNGFFGSIDSVSARGGILYLAHPMRSGEIRNAAFTTDVLKRYPTVRGIEVLNVGQFERNNSIILWDSLLTALMPSRRVFGLSSDDAHSTGMAGHGWTVLLTGKADIDGVKEALTNGTMLFSTPLLVADPQGEVPIIESITLSRSRGTISIEARNCDKIEWTSQGKVVTEGSKIAINKTEGIEKYLRATLTGKGGKTFTQAWGIE